MLSVRGAREHNLRDIDVAVPHGALTVVTGVSGSGKSSLAFDTFFREGQRRYLESLSTYARQYLGKLGRPAADDFDGMQPAVAVDQRTSVRSPRSTVGTLSELADHLRILFARAGTAAEHIHLHPPLFSFNSPHGACPECNGLGVEDRVDPDLLIADPARTLRQGALVPTTPTGYIVYSQVTVDVLDELCREHGFDVDTPWCDLTKEQQHVVLYGSRRRKVVFGKHPLESRMRWEGITARPRETGYYRGLVPTIQETLARNRNKNALRFARTAPCSACDGTRLCPRARAVTVAGQGFPDVLALSVGELSGKLATMALPESVAPVVAAVVARCRVLEELGLGYLTLDRPAPSLSAGEAQRIRLASQAVTHLQGLLYVLDEPSIGLHARDQERLAAVLERLCDNGNTVVVVDHDRTMMRRADWIVDLGPGAGADGGQLLFSGAPEALLRHETAVASETRAYLRGDATIPVPTDRRTGNGELRVEGASANNLCDVDATFLLGALNIVTGVSGAGKSSLVDAVLGRALAGDADAGAHRAIHGAGDVSKVIRVDQSPIGRTPRSNPATYTGAFDAIRALFAAQEAAVARGWDKGRFSFNKKGGRCETCEGAGVEVTRMHGLPDVALTCSRCDGRRFHDDTLAVRYEGHSIRDVLELSVDAACALFRDEGVILRALTALQEVGLGYVALGQPSPTLSGGEAQRVKLAAELAKPTSRNALYLFDEPTVGLHAADIAVFVRALDRLVENGHTAIVIEHDLDVVKLADRVIDLGPDAGTRGGQVVACGTPEEIAQVDTHTGRALREWLAGARTAVERGRREVARRPIELRGVRTNNLRGIDVTIPARGLTVITGVSGSGKSSLAFDTLHSEGRRRFAESLSSQARRSLGHTARADVESCAGLTPSIATMQRVPAGDRRSTVGTMTEVQDWLRLIYARAGERTCTCGETFAGSRCHACGRTHEQLTARTFSFNHQHGACPVCRGLGAVLRTDPDKLVTNPDRSLADGAMRGTKTGRFHGERHGQFLAILEAVGAAHDVDFSVPWRDLDAKAREIAMFGTGEQRYDVTWRFRRGKREGDHSFESDWPGFARYVDREYERKMNDARGKELAPLLSEHPCAECDGTRLRAGVRDVTFAGRTLAEVTAVAASQTLAWLRDLDAPEALLAVSSEPRDRIVERLTALVELGAGYLPLARTVRSLSSGEAQRVRLATQVAGGLRGITYVLDEPTLGLHSRDTARLVAVLRRLEAAGNTVVVVEHDPDVIRAADHVIELGPAAGVHGGTVVASGTPEELVREERSRTGALLRGIDAAERPARELGPDIRITGACANNLADIDVAIPTRALVGVSGVSGSGKSSLALDVLAASVAAGRAVACRAIAGAGGLSVAAVDAAPIGSSPASVPATYAGFFDAVRGAFARSPEAERLGLTKARFSFTDKRGRCSGCDGVGRVRTRLDFLPDVWLACEECGGARYGPEVLACRWNGRTIADVLALCVREAREVFAETKAIASKLALLDEVGLGYLTLGQPAPSLSGGEAQRLRLAVELMGHSASGKLYVFDEPTRGLHHDDVTVLLGVFDRLVDAGNTLVVVEHDERVLAHADRVIELGPGGGPAGGRLLCGGS